MRIFDAQSLAHIKKKQYLCSRKQTYKTGKKYNFTVTSGSSIYTGTASALLKKGEYVVATGLKLTHQQ